jgi:hypothetical protein
VSAVAAFVATLAPELVRVLCLCFAVIVAIATFHRTEFAKKRWSRTIPVGLLFVLVAVGMLLGARLVDRRVQAKTENGPSNQDKSPQAQNDAAANSTPASSHETDTNKPKHANPKKSEVKPVPVKPSQDNSVHIGDGARIGQNSNGDCSPNMIGGSNTVNCDVPPQIATTKLSENVPDNSLFKTDFRLVIVAKRAFLLHVKATAQNIVGSLKIDDVRPPEQGGKAFASVSTSGSGYVEEDYRDIESGSYIVTIHTSQPSVVSLECH